MVIAVTKMILRLILESKILKWKVFLKYSFLNGKLVLNPRIKDAYFQVFINWQNLGWFSNKKISAFLGFSQINSSYCNKTASSEYFAHGTCVIFVLIASKLLCQLLCQGVSISKCPSVRSFLLSKYKFSFVALIHFLYKQ